MAVPFIFSVHGSLICAGVIMLSLLQAAGALSLSSLLLQADANPVGLSDGLASSYAPDHRGAVASESTICSDIGINLLKQGGNAADAVS